MKLLFFLLIGVAAGALKTEDIPLEQYWSPCDTAMRPVQTRAKGYKDNRQKLGAVKLAEKLRKEMDDKSQKLTQCQMWHCQINAKLLGAMLDEPDPRFGFLSSSRAADAIKKLRAVVLDRGCDQGQFSQMSGMEPEPLMENIEKEVPAAGLRARFTVWYDLF
jgi:hypothetical protein